MADPRHNSRIIALQQLFGMSFPGTKLINKPTFSVKELEEIDEIDRFDPKLLKRIVDGVVNNVENIDSIIQELAPEWPLDKIAKTDLNILRIAIYEGFFLDLTPEKVAVDEAIELAREFSNEQSRKFVNGVLGSLIKDKDRFKELLNEQE